MGQKTSNKQTDKLKILLYPIKLLSDIFITIDDWNNNHVMP